MASIAVTSMSTGHILGVKVAGAASWPSRAPITEPLVMDGACAPSSSTALSTASRKTLDPALVSTPSPTGSFGLHSVVFQAAEVSKVLEAAAGTATSAQSATATLSFTALIPTRRGAEVSNPGWNEKATSPVNTPSTTLPVRSTTPAYRGCPPADTATWPCVPLQSSVDSTFSCTVTAPSAATVAVGGLANLLTASPCPDTVNPRPTQAVPTSLSPAITRICARARQQLRCSRRCSQVASSATRATQQVVFSVSGAEIETAASTVPSDKASGVVMGSPAVLPPYSPWYHWVCTV
mmetsp:Transcript_57396/g.132252  ORF Transcript_57396/g.132252 Transcript_57396/m.132252 type:complete len:294 (+) Transcript_57396:2651-3532(+)